MQKLNGTVIGKQTVRLSWGRNPANKQVVLSPPSPRGALYSHHLLMFVCIWKNSFWGFNEQCRVRHVISLGLTVFKSSLAVKSH